MEDACRICMGKPEALDNIFDGTPSQSEPSIADMISQYTGFSVAKGDSLPESICSPCLQDVRNAFQINSFEQSREQQNPLTEDEEGPPQMEFFTITEFKSEDDEEELQNFNSEVQNEGVDGDLRQDVEPYGDYNNFQVKNEPIEENSVEEDYCEVEWQVKREGVDYDEPEDNNDKDYIDESGVLGKDGRTADELPFKCSHCSKSFSDQRKLKKHILYHNSKKTYQCSQCPKSFLSPSNLENHVRTHTGERPHKCSQCPKSYAQLSALNTHYLSHSGERPHKCPHCPKSFLTSPSLKVHVRSHSGERPYQCTLCPKTFLRRSYLDNHYSVHTDAIKESENLEGMEIFKCSHCPKTFLKEAWLKKHIRNYSSEKAHKCSLCPKSFISRTNLEDHIRTHTGERPFQCPQCPKSFSSAIGLKRHVLTHSTEKAHHCPHCSRSFIVKENLTRHLRSHSPSLKGPSTGSEQNLEEEDILGK